MNAWDQGIGQGFRTTGILGATLGARMTAYLLLRMAVFYALVKLWNNLFFGDEEDELSEQDRARLHVILGRDEDGKIRMLRLQGAFSDFLGWFGAEDVAVAMSEVEKGRADVGDVLTAMMKAPVNRLATSLTPIITLPLETAAGRQFWPDFFDPRPIPDRWRHVAELFSAEHEYDLIFDRPSRGYAHSLEELVTAKRDARELAYSRIKGMAYDWLRREKGLTARATTRRHARRHCATGAWRSGTATRRPSARHWTD